MLVYPLGQEVQYPALVLQAKQGDEQLKVVWLVVLLGVGADDCCTNELATGMPVITRDENRDWTRWYSALAQVDPWLQPLDR